MFSLKVLLQIVAAGKGGASTIRNSTFKLNINQTKKAKPKPDEKKSSKKKRSTKKRKKGKKS